MPSVTYQPKRSPTQIDAPLGATARDVALAYGVDGIIGECGGQLMCARATLRRRGVPAPAPRVARTRRRCSSRPQRAARDSRLSCQIKLTEELDG